MIFRTEWLHVTSITLTLLCFSSSRSVAQEAAAPSDTLVISYKVPTDTTDPNDLKQSAIFAWNQFIALTWPAAAQGKDNKYPRETPDINGTYGKPGPSGQVVWETFRHKVEIFPFASAASPNGQPNGYDPAGPDFGYSSKPEYNYFSPIPALLQGTTTPFNNLDESTQIGLNVMYAGVFQPRDAHSSTATDRRQKILFQAKANKPMYQYAVQTALKDGQFNSNNRDTYITNAVGNFRLDDPTLFVKPYTQLPISNSDADSLQVGTIEIKSAFRRLGAKDDPTKFYTAPVRYYVEEEDNGRMKTFYIDSNNPEMGSTWGLIALHIIHKTPNSPSFCYTTFGHINNILDADGNDVEEPNGLTKGQYTDLAPFDPALSITESLVAQPHEIPPPPADGQAQKVMLRGQGEVNTNSRRLYYRNIGDVVISKPDGTPYTDPVNLNRRLHKIPKIIREVNAEAQQLIKTKFPNSPVWSNYRLVNVQAKALDFTDDKVEISNELATYYLANEVVESNVNLQQFRGGLTKSGVGMGTTPGAAIDLLNMYQLEDNKVVRYNMGGCMGCHGPQGQFMGGDFSVIFARHKLNFVPETLDEDEQELGDKLFNSGKMVRETR